MTTSWTERQIPRLNNGCQRKIGVKMREQNTATRRFPSEIIAEHRSIDRNQHQTILTGTMLGNTFDNFLGSGEVDKTVCLILRGAGIDVIVFGARPFLSFTNVKNSVAWHLGKPLWGGGAALVTRTPDPSITNAVLYQLS